MAQYGVIQAIVMSFFSRSLYRDVADNWGGKAWLYLLFILALSWIGASYQLQMAVNDGFDKYSPIMIEQMPEILIQDGQLQTPENRPYVITDPQTKETLAIIDASGQFTDINTVATPVLITQHAVITKPKSNEVRTNNIPSNITVLIKPKAIDAFVGNLVVYAGVMFFFLVWLNSYVFRLFQAHLYAVLGKFFNLLCQAKLQYPQVLQITMVALTPTIVISSILDFLNITIPFQWLYYFTLTLLYILFGVRANKKPITQPSQAQE